MVNEILYIRLPDFASHETACLMEAVSSDEQQLKTNQTYANKIVDTVKHTGNGIDRLKLWDGEAYTNSESYIHQQAVFLENNTPERVEMYYQFNNQGFCSLFPL